MKMFGLISVVFMLLLALNSSAQSLEDQINALEQESDNIQNGYNALNNDIGNYNVVEKQLEAEINNNEVERQEVNRKYDQVESERLALNSDMAAYDSDCGSRTFYLDQEGEQAAYDNCIAIRSGIEARLNAYNSQFSQVEGEIISFNSKSALLTQRSDQQKSALAELNNREQKLQDRKVELDRKYQVLINSPAFQQLINAEGMSKQCADILKSDNVNKFEIARDCLDAIFDGR